MFGHSRQIKYWFKSESETSIFFPFGLNGEGYIVRNELIPQILRWSFWHAQIPSLLLVVVVAPAFVFLAPLLAGDHRAGWLAILLLAAFYFAGASAVFWLAARVMFAVLLWDCPRLERPLTREERHSGAGQIGGRLGYPGPAPLSICMAGLTAALATSLAGVPRLDALMIVAGLVATGCFVLPLLVADADALTERYRAWKARRRDGDHREDGPSAFGVAPGQHISTKIRRH